MAYNIKYQQKAYIIIMCIKSMLIFYTISCEVIWQYWIHYYYYIIIISGIYQAPFHQTRALYNY